MTKEEMQQRKRELGLTYEEIAQRSGLSVPTVQRIISGTTENPRSYSRALIEGALKNPVVRERAAVYTVKEQGEYTFEDYFEFPDDQRCELIDGVVYDLASPSLLHQAICKELADQLSSYVKKNKGSCMVFGAPVDIVAERRTVIQPDVFVICKPAKKDLRGKPVPAFVAEVVSTSSIRNDYLRKPGKYAAAGVREYWIIDREKESITVYLMDDPVGFMTYSFFEPVPVSIWGGQCVIDLSPVKETEAFLGELSIGE